MSIKFFRIIVSAVIIVAGSLPPTASLAAASQSTAKAQALVPLIYRKLPNGLKVVLAPDRSVPTVAVGVYYGVGWRLEPKGRTGYAHLFEHLMFQGSANLPKGGFDSLIEGNGGSLNGSTRWDYTNYYQVAPSHLAQTMIWAEADRMKSLALTAENLKNQQDVVKNEVRVNVLNQPYGDFIWLDMPQAAFSNWHNAHNFYGDLQDIDAATLPDAIKFHDGYYPPNNAVVVVAGDIDPEQAFNWVKQYFGPIPARSVAKKPDLSEAEPKAEKIVRRLDKLAPRPALAFAYPVPPRNTPEWYAFGLIEELLDSGDDSLLVQKLVREKGYTDSVSGGINAFLGGQFSYNGPMLMTFGLIHDPSVKPEAIMTDVDAVMDRFREKPVTAEDLDLIRTRQRSALYNIIGSSTRFGLMDLLASLALFDDNPSKINQLEQGFAAVTPELIQKTAQKYLTPARRTVMIVEPGAAQGDKK